MCTRFLPSPLKGNICSNIDSEDIASVCHSVFVAGNLNVSIEEENSEDEQSDIEDIQSETFEGLEDISICELEKAEQILENIFGYTGVIKNLIRALILGLLDGNSDIALQALVYKVHALFSGKHSVRYLESYGMYWSGVRNLVKSRGLIVFKEHFPVPSNLSKFKKKVLEICGLDSGRLGKSGLQKENVALWIDRKKKENPGGKLALSLAIDGKKIAVTKHGWEDLGGLGNRDSVSEMCLKHENNKYKLLDHIKKDDRESLFKLYDGLTSSSTDIISKLAAVEVLVQKTVKQVDKNPLLRKYVYVLRQQLESGKSLLKQLDFVQNEVINDIALTRCSQALLPDKDSETVDLSKQPNYFRLSQGDEKLEKIDIKVIETCKTKAKDLLEISWFDLVNEMQTPVSKLHKKSRVFTTLQKMVIMTDYEVFKACGLDNRRPMKDMQEVYERTRMKDECRELNERKQNIDNILATFVSLFAPMTFGNNLLVRDGGMVIEEGVCGCPDLVVMNRDGKNVIYSVICLAVENNCFKCDEEMLTTCLINAKLVKAKQGCLLVLFSEENCLIFSIPGDEILAEKMIQFIKAYVRKPSCLKKRNQEMIIAGKSMKTVLKEKLSSVVMLGRYPIVQNVVESSPGPIFNHIVQPNSDVAARSTMKSDKIILSNELTNFLDATVSFLSKQAKELVCVNLSDLSGCISKFPHTLLAASYLSSVSLKIIVREVISEVKNYVESQGVELVNVAVDGESLHMLTSLSDGTPGTELALVKQILHKLKQFSKEDLCQLIATNKDIEIDKDGEELMDDELDYFWEVAEDNVENVVEDHLADIYVEEELEDGTTLEDLEIYFGKQNCTEDLRQKRYNLLKTKKVLNLRNMCLNYILPLSKINWLRKAYGSDVIVVQSVHGEYEYIPNTVFEKTSSGLFFTITFDAAHLANLLRESAAKGKLTDLGLSDKCLRLLSSKPNFSYLRKIISLKNSKLEFDPMNQRSSSLCFSEKTEEGLLEMKDLPAAKCCRLIRKGVIESFDTSGLSSEERCENIWALKQFLYGKIDICDRIKRPGKGAITNELLQMIHASCDSHLVTSLNLEFFHPRRKMTGSVEQFFGQITMLCDGGMKLDCAMISDILSRVTITNSLRLVPDNVKGFSFLKHLKMHMKSYSVEDSTELQQQQEKYPRLKLNSGCSFHPADSNFDRPSSRKRKTLSNSKMVKMDVNYLISEGEVRKHHKKF